MQALRLYMALGQRDKVVTVLVDTARTCLAVKDAARASTLLLKANTLVDQVRLRFESQRLGVPKTFCAWSCKPTASGCPHNDTHPFFGSLVFGAVATQIHQLGRLPTHTVLGWVYDETLARRTGDDDGGDGVGARVASAVPGRSDDSSAPRQPAGGRASHALKALNPTL